MDFYSFHNLRTKIALLLLIAMNCNFSYSLTKIVGCLHYLKVSIELDLDLGYLCSFEFEGAVLVVNGLWANFEEAEDLELD